MTQSSTVHATIFLERTYDAAPARVFAAWESADARSRWGPPDADTEVIFLETDFRVGGRDRSRCGQKGNATFVVEGRYLDIVADRRIVFSETVEHEGARLSASLITVEIRPEGVRTTLSLTVQIAAFDGSGMAEGAEAGWGPALDNLAAELAGQPVAV
jgi:uncharacterized protein YndB with AHSA1/START domain